MIPKLGRRWLWLLLPVVLGLAVVLWRSTAKAEVGVWKQASAAQRAKQAVTGASMPMRPDGNGGQFAGDPRGLPEAMPDPNDLPAQRALWEKRLARSTEVLENYRRTTRYPFESRPASEHGDQMYPNQALIEENIRAGEQRDQAGEGKRDQHGLRDGDRADGGGKVLRARRFRRSQRQQAQHQLRQRHCRRQPQRRKSRLSDQATASR